MTIKKQLSIKVLASEIEFHGAREFFEFFSSYNVDFWIIEAMPRKLNGERGAPIAGLIEWQKNSNLEKSQLDRRTYFPFKRAFGSKLVLWNLQKLLSYLFWTGKKNIDLHIKESPANGQYYRTILIDDLTSNSVDRLLDWWSGPLAVIETSLGNFQAVLVVIDRYGLYSVDKLNVARALAKKFDGDRRAVAASQFHRFPGSSNNKRTMLDGSLPFISRLTVLRGSLDGRDGSECIRQLISTAASRRDRIRAGITEATDENMHQNRVASSSGTGRDETPSGEAFRWAISALKNGMVDEELALGLLLWVGDHDPVDWIPRTIHNARAVLAGSDLRYRRLRS